MKRFLLIAILIFPLTGTSAPPATQPDRAVGVDTNGNLTPAITMRPGAGQIWIHGADIASASTVNLTTATGDLIDVTGTATINAVTLAEGMSRTVRFTGAGTITHGSSLVLPGQANITRAAGDFAVFRSYGGVIRCTSYTKLDGTPIIGSSGAPFPDSTPVVKGSGDATKLLKIEVDGFTTGTTRTWTAQNFSGTVSLWESANVFTNVQTIDTGSNADVDTEGFLMRNDTVSTALLPLQNAPLIVFEAHGWDGAADHGWEMNEKFFTYATGLKSKFSWEFSENEGPYEEKVYIDSSGGIAGTGYVTSGVGFGFICGAALFNNNVVSLSSTSAAISNGNTTVPLLFNSTNTTATAWQFRAANTLTSGNLIEGIVPNSGFTGSYLKLGKSSNGTSMTTTVFDLTTAGDLTISGNLTAANFVPNVGCRLTNTGNISIPNNAFTVLTFDNEIDDTDSMHSTSSNTSRITFTRAGRYNFAASIRFQESASGYRLIGVFFNGSTPIAADGRVPVPGAGIQTDMGVSGTRTFSAGDYIEVKLFQDSGAALNCLAFTEFTPAFTAVRIP